MRPSRTIAPSAAPLGLSDLAFSALGALTPGRTRARLTEEFQKFLGVDDVFFVSSGTAALTVSLTALRSLRSARRVAIPAYTCYTAPAAVIRAGLEPVLVDMDPETFDFDEASLRRVLALPDVLCVMPTHLFGVPSDVDRVRALRQRGVFVLEDAAQAFGLTTADRRRMGSLGDVSVVSFGRGKHLTCGGGGLIATSSKEIAALCRAQCAQLEPAGAVRALRTWAELLVMSMFLDPRLYWLPSGIPSLGLGETYYEEDFSMTQLSATGAGALRQWRTRLERSNGQRRVAVEAWCRDLGLRLTPARQRALLRLPVLLESAEQRASVLESARRLGLGVSRMYPLPLHRVPELRERFKGQRFPGAEALAERLVTLPAHGFVGASDRARLAAIWPAAPPAPSATTTTAVATVW